MTSESAAFWSYAHDDDRFDGGRVVKLAQHLQEEFALITGTPLTVFVDRSAIQWGDEWRQRIDDALVQTTFFIPIITPRYFTRAECRRELLDFYGEAKGRGLDRMLMPIRYVTVPNLTKENPDEAMALVSRMHYEDWTELRLAALESEVHRRAVNKLARRLADLAEEVAASQLDRERIEVEEGGFAATGLVDIIEQLGALLPGWRDLVQSDEATEAQYDAVDTVYTKRLLELSRQGRRGPWLATLHRLAQAQMPLATKHLEQAESFSAITIEMNPLVLSLVRALEESGIEPPEFVAELRGAVSDALRVIDANEVRAASAGKIDASVYWGQQAKLGRTFRELAEVQKDSLQYTYEANQMLVNWAELLDVPVPASLDLYRPENLERYRAARSERNDSGDSGVL
jgi:hypothetical protein